MRVCVLVLRLLHADDRRTPELGRCRACTSVTRMPPLRAPGRLIMPREGPSHSCDACLQPQPPTASSAAAAPSVRAGVLTSSSSLPVKAMLTTMVEASSGGARVHASLPPAVMREVRGHAPGADKTGGAATPRPSPPRVARCLQRPPPPPPPAGHHALPRPCAGGLVTALPPGLPFPASERTPPSAAFPRRPPRPCTPPSSRLTPKPVSWRRPAGVHGCAGAAAGGARGPGGAGPRDRGRARSGDERTASAGRPARRQRLRPRRRRSVRPGGGAVDDGVQ